MGYGDMGKLVILLLMNIRLIHIENNSRQLMESGN